MKTEYRIIEERALSALLGKSPACIWQTETTDYRLDEWKIYDDGLNFCASSRPFRTFAAAAREKAVREHYNRGTGK
jgi:hypothetical protein